MVTEEGGALYILDRSNDILMAYNEKYQKQLKELKEQEIVKEISDNEITTGNLKDDFIIWKENWRILPINWSTLFPRKFS